MVSVFSHLSHRMAKIQQNIFCQITTPIYFVVFVVVETVDNFAFSAVWCSLSKDSINIKSWTFKNRGNIWNIFDEYTHLDSFHDKKLKFQYNRKLEKRKEDCQFKEFYIRCLLGAWFVDLIRP